MKPIHYSETDFQKIEVNNIPALFTNARVDRDSLPKGYYAYDIRSGDRRDFSTIEPVVLINHTGTILTQRPIKMTKGDYTPIKDYNFLGEIGIIEN